MTADLPVLAVHVLAAVALLAGLWRPEARWASPVMISVALGVVFASGYWLLRQAGGLTAIGLAGGTMKGRPGEATTDGPP